MHTMIISTAAGMRDLIALAREIEALEGTPRRLALRLAHTQLEDLLIDVEADVRYCPAGEHEAAWVSLSVGPLLWDGTSPLLAVGCDDEQTRGEAAYYTDDEVHL
jgi:hypothetical protein